MKTFKILFAAVLFAGFTTTAFAQTADEASISANATVLQSATLTGVSDLEFGEVIIGTAKIIEADVAAAGHFTLMTNTASTISFTLPENLTAEIDDIDRFLPVSFDGNYGRVSGLDNAGVEMIETFNPTSAYDLTTAGFDHANEFDINLGGEVTPAANQAAGSYTAEVILSVTYN